MAANNLTNSDNWREYFSLYIGEKNDFGIIRVRNLYPDEENKKSFYLTLTTKQGQIKLTGWAFEYLFVVNCFNCPVELYTPGRIRAILPHCVRAGMMSEKERINVFIERKYYFRWLDARFKEMGFTKWRGRNVTCIFAKGLPKQEQERKNFVFRPVELAKRSGKRLNWRRLVGG